MDVMTQVAECVIFNVCYKIWSRNPREMYVRWTTLSSISWGSTLPVYSGIVIISRWIPSWSIQASQADTSQA